MADTIDELATALHELRERLGEEAFSDKRRVISILSDKVVDAKREIRAVGTAIDEGVPGALAGSQRQYVGWEMDRQTDRLEASTGLNLDLARKTVRAFGYALDLGPLPSTYKPGPITSPSAGPPDIGKPPEAAGWLGETVTPPPPLPTPSPARPPGQPFGAAASRAPSPGSPSGGWTPPPAPSVQPNPGGQHQSPGWAQPTVYVVAPPGHGGINKVLIGIVVVLVAFIAVAGWIGYHDNDKPVAAPTAVPVSPGPVTPGPVTPGPVVPGSPGIGAPIDRSGGDGPGDESRDFNVPVRTELQTGDYIATPTPLSNPAAVTLTTAQVKRMMAQSPGPLLLDVWVRSSDPRAYVSLPGASAAPHAGDPGTFSDDLQHKMAAALARTPAAQAGRPLIFFCVSVRCWEGYNAVLRASAAGARNLYWYRGGLEAWQAAGEATQPLAGGPPNPNQPARNGSPGTNEPIDSD